MSSEKPILLEVKNLTKYFPIRRGLLKRVVGQVRAVDGVSFFIREGGRWLATPLFLVLLVIETADVTFALDSIPAVFGITRDPFIVFTSNVFAILGLRALYFLLAGVLDYFSYLSTGLALVLLFIGGKMIAEPWMHIPVHLSLAIVGGILLAALLASLLRPPRKADAPAEKG